MGRRKLARTALTHRIIEKIEPPAKGRTHLYDSEVPGLAIAVMPSGVRSFYWIGRIRREPTRMFLGQYPELPLDRARDEAKRIAGEAADGKRPTPRRRNVATEPTLGAIFNEWMAIHSRPHKRTWRSDEKRFARTMSQWMLWPLSQLTRKEVQEHHVAMGEADGIFAANKMLELLGTLYKFAEEHRHWSGKNPVRGIKRFHETERDRFLSQDELARFFAAVETLRPDARDIFLLCLFTGARRSNVMAMRWSELDLKHGTWRVPPINSKNKEAMILPLSKSAKDIVERRAQSRRSEFVFPSWGSTGHYCCPKNAWETLKKRAKLENVRIHDLRRTLGSYEAMTGASLPIIAKSLGHENTSATDIYARLQLQPVRDAIENATATMLSAAQQKTESSKNP